MLRPFTQPRKVFSIVDNVFDEAFIFPGAALPGPEAPRLTEPKRFQDKDFGPGDFDPEWVPPDEENIYLGIFNGRLWHSIRDDISTELADLGNPKEELDPQTHTTVPEDVYDYFADSPYLVDVFNMYGVGPNAETRYKTMFPDAKTLKSALENNPNVITEFLANDAATVHEVLAKLGVEKE